MRKNVVIWGASGHALAVTNALRCLNTGSTRFDILGYIDDLNTGRKGERFQGQTILGGEEVLECLTNKDTYFALGFGHCGRRVEIAKYLTAKGFQLITLVHPESVIAEDVTIGQGSVVLAGAVIDPRSQIGRYTIINNNVVISHGCQIEDGVHICPGANIAGDVQIGQGTWIGIGSNVVDKITIGRGSYIGAGSVVTKDIPDFVLAYGNPARVIRAVDGSF